MLIVNKQQQQKTHKEPVEMDFGHLMSSMVEDSARIKTNNYICSQRKPFLTKANIYKMKICAVDASYLHCKERQHRK